MRRTCQMFSWIEDVTPAICTHEHHCTFRDLDGIGWTELILAMNRAKMTKRRMAIVVMYLQNIPKPIIEQKLSITRSGLNKAIKQGLDAIRQHDRGVVTSIIEEFGIEGFADVAEAYS